MLIVVLFCFLFAFNVGWNSMQYAENSRAALKWPVVEGHVRIYRSRRSYHRDYLYSISGHTYSGDLFELPNAIGFFDFYSKSKYKNGQRILVYFDPTAPEKSAVNRSLDERRYIANMICSAVAVLLGVSAVGAFINDATSHKARLGFR